MNDERGELHEMNPTGRFTDRADDYVKYRPDYPADVFTTMLAGLGEPASLVAADVGAGTGISARALAAHGPRVIAIEPNAAMRAAAEPHPRVEWRDGTAEATGLADSSVPLVLCAQAFHWFRAVEALAEFHRVLVPGGRLALLWNSRDKSDPLTAGYTQAIRAVGGDHPAEMREIGPEIVPASGAFEDAGWHWWPNGQWLDRDGLIGRATSASYVPREGAARDELVRLLDALFAQHRDAQGRVRLAYRTGLYLARAR